MKTTLRTYWWTLMFKDESLDIDGDNLLHLFPTREDAEEEAGTFIDGINPVPVKIKLCLVT